MNSLCEKLVPNDEPEKAPLVTTLYPIISRLLSTVMVLVGNSIRLFFSSLMSGLVLHFSPRIRNSVRGSPSTSRESQRVSSANQRLVVSGQ